MDIEEVLRYLMWIILFAVLSAIMVYGVLKGTGLA
jgi:hypothetical protein